jgi:hypothetical protein
MERRMFAVISTTGHPRNRDGAKFLASHWTIVSEVTEGQQGDPHLRIVEVGSLEDVPGPLPVANPGVFDGPVPEATQTSEAAEGQVPTDYKELLALGQSLGVEIARIGVKKADLIEAVRERQEEIKAQAGQ